MNYKEKYIKYKTKYIDLQKNIDLQSKIKLNGGMIDVLPNTYIDSIIDKKTKDINNIKSMYTQLFGTYVNILFDNHVHNLLGFIDMDTSNYYLIDNIILDDIKSDYIETDNNKIILNNLNIKNSKIENELYEDITKLSQIELGIISFLKQNKNKLKYMNNIKINTTNKIFFYENCKITVNFIKLNQSGGFNPLIQCVSSKINGLVKIFSEPVIDFINNTIQIHYYTLIKDGNKHEFPLKYGELHKEVSDKVSDDDLQKYYVMIEDILEKDKGELKFIKNVLEEIHFTKDMLKNRLYIKEILLHHLLNNKYAHNGINDLKILEQASKLIEKELLDINNLVFMHGYLHYLDELNMYNEEYLMKYDLQENIKKLLRGCFKKSLSIICYENLLNKNQYNFLKKSDSGKYIFPYRISMEALNDKKRQYAFSDNLYNNFYLQLSVFHEPIISSEETTKPYGRNEYLKKKYNNIINCIITNKKIKDIKLINKDTHLHDIIKLITECKITEYNITKDDLVNIILIYLNNYQYIEEFTV